jgi:hypothetical protein
MKAFSREVFLARKISEEPGLVFADSKADWVMY